MPISLVPRERQFFVFFRDNAANMMESLHTLNRLLNSGAKDFAEHAKKLRDIEHEGDEVTHTINRELNATFITPFDREDIYALAGALDDVIDLAEEIADTVILDRVESITPEAREMGAILLQIGGQLSKAFDELETRKEMTHYWVDIHDLENQGDRITREAIGALFQNSPDPVDIIKWKDIYALLEKTIDRTEDVANILESVTIKNA
jgi:uncharacterized protein